VKSARMLRQMLGGHRRRRVLASVGLALLAALLAIGIPSPTEGKQMSTVYRSAVGAQEPRAAVSLDGVTIAYADSRGGGHQSVPAHRTFEIHLPQLVRFLALGAFRIIGT
jgi:hypothetical protein